jgi:parallel beta-helix repeat protein
MKSLSKIRDRLLRGAAARAARRRSRPLPLRLEELEQRCTPTMVISVNSAADDPAGPTPGVVTLRDAINQANAVPPTVELNILINFDILQTGPITIKLQQDLPIIHAPQDPATKLVNPITIDGSSENPGLGVPPIVLDGSTEMPPGTTGLEVASNQVTIDGLQIKNFQKGIVVDSNATGTIIGGTTSDARNTVFSNAAGGIIVGGSGTTVEGNYVGLQADGLTAGTTAQAAGIQVLNTSTGDVIGGSQAGAGNVISGNVIGLQLQGSGTSGSPIVVAGNKIGTSASGSKPVPNSGDGIQSTGSFIAIGGSAGSANFIGFNGANGLHFIGADTTTVGPFNVIFKNGNDGVLIENSVDVNVTHNSIDSNGHLGIELVSANNGQLAPVVASATLQNPTTIVVQGSLDARSVPPSIFEYMIEIYANPSGSNAQGKTFLGSLTMAAPLPGASGILPFGIILSNVPSSLGTSFITATATGVANVNGSLASNTSEFSAATLLTAPSSSTTSTTSSSSSSSSSSGPTPVTPGNVPGLFIATFQAIFTSLFSNPGALGLEFQLLFNSFTLLVQSFFGTFDNNLAQQASNLAFTLENTPGTGFSF